MIRALHFTADGALRTDIPVESLPEVLAAGGLLWVDFVDSPPAEDEPILRTVFGFHPLAIDDALSESHVPKLDDWGDYLYLVLHSVVYDTEDGGHLTTLEVDFFVGRNYIVTHHDQQVEALDRVWKSVQRDERHLRSGVERLLYLLADELVAAYMPAIDAIEEAVDKVEDEILGVADKGTVERIFGLKRALLRLRRILAPQREVMSKLARDDYVVIAPANRVFYRDIYDHLVRLYDLTENLRDLVAGSMDMYLSVVNNRMNSIMKTLTIVTTIFMPLSFVVGFFGMNFFQPVVGLDTWTGMASFVATLALTVLIPVGMFIWMRRRGWM